MANKTEDKLLKLKDKVAQLEQQRRLEIRQEREAQRKKNKWRNAILGSYIAEIFPEEVTHFEPYRKNADNDIEFRSFRLFLKVLAEDQELVARLKSDAARRLSMEEGTEHPEKSSHTHSKKSDNSKEGFYNGTVK